MLRELNTTPSRFRASRRAKLSCPRTRATLEDDEQQGTVVALKVDRVLTRVVRLDWRMVGLGNKLLDVSHALHVGDRHAKCEVIPETRSEVHAVWQ